MNRWKSMGALFMLVSLVGIGCGDPTDLDDEIDSDDPEADTDELSSDSTCKHVFDWEDMPPHIFIPARQQGPDPQQDTRETCR